MSEVVLRGGDDSSGLFVRVSALVEQASATAASHANATLTLLYWEIGNLIHVEVLQQGRAEYAQQIVGSLAPQLSWTHLTMLLPVRTDEALAFYIEQAITGRPSARALRELIGRQGFERKEIANSQTPGGSAVPADLQRPLLPRVPRVERCVPGRHRLEGGALIRDGARHQRRGGRLHEAASRILHPNPGWRLQPRLGHRLQGGDGQARVLRRRDQRGPLVAAAQRHRERQDRVHLYDRRELRFATSSTSTGATIK